MKIVSKIRSKLNLKCQYSARDAYRFWSETYDNQQDNLMLYYDKIILKKFLKDVNLKNKTILDFGCGTGRNWTEFYKNKPAAIIGCDLSPEMLQKLKSKFPDAESYLLHNNKLPFLHSDSCDIIVSTLVIAHLETLEETFSEWDRVLKNNGDIIITDFHPALLSKGGARSFNYKDKKIVIKNYIHNIKKIKDLLFQFGFSASGLIENFIDHDIKHFYKNKNAVGIYNKFKNLPFIYGLHLSRSNADQ